MPTPKSLRIAGIVVAVVLGIMGAMKLAMPGMTEQSFTTWGYPAWFGFVIGAAEVATAVLLLVPRTSFYGAALGGAIMAGAIFTHLKMPEVGMLPLAVPLFLAAAWVAWNTRPNGSATTA